MGDRLEHLRQRPDVARLEEDAPDGYALPRDVRLAQDAAPVGQLGAEPHGVERRRQDGPPHGQHLARDADRVEEVARDLGEGGEEEVPEAVARELPVAREPELEELRHQRLDLRQRDETVADVARRQHLELVAQPSRAAPVVGHGDDGRQRRHAPAEVALERREDHREARAAADCDDPASPVVPPARCHVFDLSARAAAAPRSAGARAATREAPRTPAAGALRSGADAPVAGWVNPEHRGVERLAAERGDVARRNRGPAASSRAGDRSGRRRRARPDGRGARGSGACAPSRGWPRPASAGTGRANRSRTR